MPSAGEYFCSGSRNDARRVFGRSVVAPSRSDWFASVVGQVCDLIRL
jgi:hypothetical protein